jgi:SAM-dependent methyltransferase
MDLSLRSGERQVAYELDAIRYDHRARYNWASSVLPHCSMVIDVGCGIGYGTHIMASGSHVCVGLDHSQETIKFALRHWLHEDLAFQHGGIEALADHGDDDFDAAVCFEVIEHVEDPLPMLLRARRVAKTLLASVPNEEVFPFKNYTFHHRHYTKVEFEDLLNRAGWRVTEWWGQTGPESEVERDVNGRTLIAVCERLLEPVTVNMAYDRLMTALDDDQPIAPELTQAAPPDHVVILGLGPSAESYVDIVKRLGARKKFADEVWAINALGDIIQCDLIFHMDDVKIQEVRAAAKPDSNIAAMVEWLKTHSGPIMTSRAYPEYPGLIEFPLEDVINKLGQCYFNNTAAFAVAWAIYLGVKKISFFGIDFTYPNAAQAEKGRGSVEFWMGFAAARGIELGMSAQSSLMDACEPDDQKIYGYGKFGTRDVTITSGANGMAKVALMPRKYLPSATEIEQAYSHEPPSKPAQLS